MNWAKILSLARTLCNADATMSGLADASLVDYLNIVYHDVEDCITTEVDHEYFYSKYFTDTIASQQKYEIQQATSSVAGFKNILEVGIKRTDDDTYYTVLRKKEERFNSTSDDYDYTATSTANGYYDIQGKYLYLYPYTAESVTDGLYIKATVTLPDITEASAETAIFPNHWELRNMHDLLVIGLKQYIYTIKGQIDLKNDAINEYESKKREMMNNLKVRIAEPNQFDMREMTALDRKRWE